MADPLRFGDEDPAAAAAALEDVTDQLARVGGGNDDPLLSAAAPAAATATAATATAAPHAAADPLSDPLAGLGPLGGAGSSSAAAAAAPQEAAVSFDPFADGSAAAAGAGDPFAAYGALGPPPSYSDATAAPAASAQASAEPQQQQQKEEQQQQQQAGPSRAAAWGSDSVAGTTSGGGGNASLLDGAGSLLEGSDSFAALAAGGGGAGPPEPWEAGLLPAPRAGASSAAPKPPPVAVEVRDPQREDGGGSAILPGLRGGHATYRVDSRVEADAADGGSALPPGWPARASVRRRFRDFVALADLVKARYRGYFAPPRPEKNAVEGSRMADAFLEERRAALDRYLRRLAAHPVLGVSEELKLFLTAPGDLAANFEWQGLAPPEATVLEGTTKFGMQLFGRESKVVDPVAAAAPAARSKDLMRAMKEAAQGLRQSSASGAAEAPDGEPELRRAKDAAEEMREALMAASRAAERVVGRLDRTGAAANDLGLTLFRVAKSEEARGGVLAAHTGTLRHASALVADEKRAAAALVRLSKMVARVAGRTAQELAPLHDYLSLMPAVVRGLTSREHALVTLHTLQADLAARQRALQELELAGAKVFGGDQGKAKRAADLRNEAAQLELSIGAARSEYERVRAINKTELERFARERRAEFGAMVENFAATQVAAHERFLEVWLQLASELGAPPAELAAIREAAPRLGNDLLGTAPQP